MPPNGPTHFVLPSLVDRLENGKPNGRGQSVTQLETAVLRDLEWLLNTRATGEAPPDEMEALQASLYSYGLPDLSSLSASSSQHRTRIRLAIQRSIEQFEPRLTDVSVHEMEPDTRNRASLRFLITGLLRTEPAPKEITFDTVLDLSRGEFRIGGGARET